MIVVRFVDVFVGAFAIVASCCVDLVSCCAAVSFCWPSFPNKGPNSVTAIIVPWRNRLYSVRATCQGPLIVSSFLRNLAVMFIM